MRLFGNREEIALDIVPVTPSWQSRYPPEQAAWAGTAIWVGGQNLSRHLAPGSNDVEDYLYLPLGPLADWIVGSWTALRFEERAADYPTSRRPHEDLHDWIEAPPPSTGTEDDWIDSREAWWSRHFLASGAEGSFIPNLAFVRDEAELVVTWRPAPRRLPSAPVMLNDHGWGAVPFDSAEETLGAFVAAVATWFRQSGHDDAYPWVTRRRPLREGGTDLSASLTYLTGRDIGALAGIVGGESAEDIAIALGLDPGDDDVAASPVTQMLRDLSPSVSTEIGHLASSLGQLSRGRFDPAAGWQVARAIVAEAARPARSPEEAGQLAATELRRDLALDGEPIGDMRELLRGFDLEDVVPGVSSPLDRMLVGGRLDGRGAVAVLDNVRTRTTWGERFEQARGLGHLLLDADRGGAIGAASGPFATRTRRRRSGAFAAELLLPETALAEASGRRLDGATAPHAFERLLHRYEVGATTAAYQLWNRHWLSSDVVRDALIEEHGGG